jgi:hypothetical protein
MFSGVFQIESMVLAADFLTGQACGGQGGSLVK